MSQASFEIKTARDFFGKLGREYAKFKADPDNSDNAINFSQTAHHLFIDWLQKEMAPNDYHVLDTKVRSTLRTELAVIKEICNGSKHFILTHRPFEQVAASALKPGGFSKGFSRAFNTGGLEVTLMDGSKVYFDQIAEKIYKFWQTYFNDQSA